MSDREPYYIEADTPGCEHCGLGARWNIVGPDGVATSTMYDDMEHAEEIADDLSAAYLAGQNDAINGVKRRRFGRDDRRRNGNDPAKAPADGERRMTQDGRRVRDCGIPF